MVEPFSVSDCKRPRHPKIHVERGDFLVAWMTRCTNGAANVCGVSVLKTRARFPVCAWLRCWSTRYLPEPRNPARLTVQTPQLEVMAQRSGENVVGDNKTELWAVSMGRTWRL